MMRKEDVGGNETGCRPDEEVRTAIMVNTAPLNHVTLRDVAALADVSISTASRVLSGSRSTGADISLRVKQAAQELGYRGNVIAAALRKSKTQTMGMVVPRISNPFFPTLVEAVERHLQADDIVLFLCDSRESTEIESKRIAALLARKVDGLLVVPQSYEGSAAALNAAAREVPLVIVDRDVIDVDAPTVRSSDETGIGLILDHLVEQGVRRARLISAALTTGTARRRHDAFIHGAAQRSIEISPPLLGAFSLEWGRAVMDEIDPLTELEAIVCGNDLIAAGVLQSTTRRGIHVPHDLMVVGYDDSAIAESMGITTVRQPSEKIASTAVGLVREGASGNRTTVLEPALIPRQTTLLQN